MNKNDIVFLQETWIETESAFDILLNEDRASKAKTFHKSPKRKAVTRGRPHGGIGWIIEHKHKVKCIFISDRISYIKINDIAIVGVYMRANNGTITNQLKYERDWDQVSQLLIRLRQDGNEVILLGDMNADLYRDNRQDKYFRQQLSRLNLVSLDTLCTQAMDHTYFKRQKQSWIDHVIVFQDTNMITQTNILDAYDNRGDHLPLQIEIEIQKPTIEPNYQRRPNRVPHHKWNDERYKLLYNSIFQRKMEIHSPAIRSLFHETNREVIQEMLKDIITKLHRVMKQAADEASGELELAKKLSYQKSKSWWTPELGQLHKQQMNIMADIRRHQTPKKALEDKLREVKRQFRRLKRQNERRIEHIKYMRIAETFRHDKTRYWGHMKKTQQDTVKVSSTVEQLKNEFSMLFNTRLAPNEEQERLATRRVEEFKQRPHLSQWYRVSKADIKWTLKNIPNGKSRGYAGAQNEMFKYCISDEMIMLLKIIFEKMINYAITPQLFNVGVIKPLVKDTSKDSGDPNNIRPITISDSMANIYEKIILIEIERSYPDSHKQFGFKKHSSCSHAVFCLREMALHSLQNKKKLFVCAIDASKAFDKINRNILWNKLIDKIDQRVMLSLIDYYENSMALVKHDGSESDMFRTTVGVKQGGPLSPKLFALYLEDFITEIEQMNIGPTIGPVKIEVILYADDILLLSNSAEEMQLKIDCAWNYANKHEIKFNPDKTVCMQIVHKKIAHKPKFYMNGKPIEYVDLMKYLGVQISCNLTSKQHILKRRQSTMRRSYQLAKSGLDSTVLPPNQKAQMYQTYCRPVLVYGLEAIHVSTNDIRVLQTTEGNIIKRCLRLSKKVRKTKLLSALGLDTIQNRVKRIKYSFMLRLINNPLTRALIGQLLLEAHSGRGISKRSVISEIKDQIGWLSENLEELKENCKMGLKLIDQDELNLQRSGEVTRIKDIIEEYNYESDRDLLGTLVRAF